MGVSSAVPSAKYDNTISKSVSIRFDHPCLLITALAEALISYLQADYKYIASDCFHSSKQNVFNSVKRLGSRLGSFSLSSFYNFPTKATQLPQSFSSEAYSSRLWLYILDHCPVGRSNHVSISAYGRRVTCLQNLKVWFSMTEFLPTPDEQKQPQTMMWCITVSLLWCIRWCIRFRVSSRITP